MMPVPTHLQGLVVPLDGVVDEAELDASVRCPCGGESFELLYPGDTTEHDGSTIPVTAERDGKFFFRIEAQCVRCRRTLLLFDADFHGWNGYVCCNSAQASLPRPALKAWNCLKCGATSHSVRVTICGEGKADFVENAGDEFPPERWVDGFGWFYLSIACDSCRLATGQWVDYETM
jgi:hypothetical protein